MAKKLIKRADGSYSQRGLWDNIRANKGSGKKPTKEMLAQEKKIKKKMANGGEIDATKIPSKENLLEYLRTPSNNFYQERLNRALQQQGFNPNIKGMSSGLNNFGVSYKTGPFNQMTSITSDRKLVPLKDFTFASDNPNSQLNFNTRLGYKDRFGFKGSADYTNSTAENNPNARFNLGFDKYGFTGDYNYNFNKENPNFDFGAGYSGNGFDANFKATKNKDVPYNYEAGLNYDRDGVTGNFGFTGNQNDYDITAGFNVGGIGTNFNYSGGKNDEFKSTLTKGKNNNLKSNTAKNKSNFNLGLLDYDKNGVIAKYAISKDNENPLIHDAKLGYSKNGFTGNLGFIGNKLDPNYNFNLNFVPEKQGFTTNASVDYKNKNLDVKTGLGYKGKKFATNVNYKTNLDLEEETGNRSLDAKVGYKGKNFNADANYERQFATEENPAINKLGVNVGYNRNGFGVKAGVDYKTLSEAQKEKDKASPFEVKVGATYTPKKKAKEKTTPWKLPKEMIKQIETTKPLIDDSPLTQEQKLFLELKNRFNKDYNLFEKAYGGTITDDMNNKLPKMNWGGKLAPMLFDVGANALVNLTSKAVTDMVKAITEPEQEIRPTKPNTGFTMAYGGMVDEYGTGGTIYIKPSKRGTFTAAADKRGMGVQEFASKVLANKDNYSSAMVKKANFAKNAAGWKHAFGGMIDPSMYMQQLMYGSYAMGGQIDPVDPKEENKIMQKQIKSILSGKPLNTGITMTKLSPDEEYTYQQWAKGLTPNLQGSMNDKNYDMRGAWQVGEQPELFYNDEQGNFQSAHPIDVNQKGSIYEPHLFSRNPFTGKSLKGPNHPSFMHALEGDIKSGGKVKMDLKTADMYTYAQGGQVPQNIPVEVEGEEMYEMPNGQMGEFQGPKHENGGIPVALPEGTKVYSDRLKVNDKTMADRKAKRERNIAKLEKLLGKSPHDKFLRQSLERQKETAALEEQQDMAMQEQANQQQAQAQQAEQAMMQEQVMAGLMQDPAMMQQMGMMAMGGYIPRLDNGTPFAGLMNSGARKLVNTIDSLLYKKIIPTDTAFGKEFQIIEDLEYDTQGNPIPIVYDDNMVKQYNENINPPYKNVIPAGTGDVYTNFGSYPDYYYKKSGDIDNPRYSYFNPKGKETTWTDISPSHPAYRELLAGLKDDNTQFKAGMFPSNGVIEGGLFGQPFTSTNLEVGSLSNPAYDIMGKQPKLDEKKKFPQADLNIKSPTTNTQSSSLNTLTNTPASSTTQSGITPPSGAGKVYQNIPGLLPNTYYRNDNNTWSYWNPKMKNWANLDAPNTAFMSKLRNLDKYSYNPPAPVVTPTQQIIPEPVAPVNPIVTATPAAAEKEEKKEKIIPKETPGINPYDVMSSIMENTFANIARAKDPYINTNQGLIPNPFYNEEISNRLMANEKPKKRNKFKNWLDRTADKTGDFFNRLFDKDGKPKKEKTKKDKTTESDDDTDLDFTRGDYMGLAGNLVGGLGPMLGTFLNRMETPKNVNFFREFGAEGLRAMQEAQALAAINRDKQLGDIKLGEEASRQRGRNSARGVNTLRALDIAADMGANQAQNQAYNMYAQQMMQLLGQKAQMENQQDQAVMTGEYQRDLADRQDIDNFYTNLTQNLASQSELMQKTGRDLNTAQYNKMMLEMSPLFSRYGIGFEMRKGKMVPVKDGKTVDERTLELIIQKEEAARKEAEKNKVQPTVTTKTEETKTPMVDFFQQMNHLQTGLGKIKKLKFK